MFRHAYYEGALQRFQLALQNDPKNADAHYNLAATYHRLGKLNGRAADLTQAETSYNRCLDFVPNHQACYRGLAVLLVEQGRNAEAQRLLEGWAARSPSLAAPHVELARLHDEAGRRAEAQQSLVDALKVEPANAVALTALGRLREQSGDTAQALANYQRSLSLDRFQPQVAARVASLQSASGLGAAPPAGNGPGGTRMVNEPTAPLR